MLWPNVERFVKTCKAVKYQTCVADWTAEWDATVR